MRRPIGVIILAAAATLAGLAQVYAMLVYLGILKFDFIGKSVSFDEAQWGAALWALIMAAIWFWVAAGFWNLRAYAAQFGIFISLFTLIRIYNAGYEEVWKDRIRARRAAREGARRAHGMSGARRRRYR